jgi:Dipeptide/tripeptide permease
MVSPTWYLFLDRIGQSVHRPLAFGNALVAMCYRWRINDPVAQGPRMTATPATIAGDPGASSDRFGHPRALTYLFATEMWERFSY